MAEKQTVVQFCQDLIRIPSYSGQEGEVVKKIREIMQAIGMDDVAVDDYGSIIGRMKGDQPGEKVLFDAHIDTVVAKAEEWTHDPFGAELVDGKIYGRGTSDMKGSLAAMLAGAKAFREKTGGHFKGEVVIAGVVHEECFEGVAARAISKRVQPDLVVIGEASQLNLKIGQRGRAEIVVETFGVPAHSANPEKGVNAVEKMVPVIQALAAMDYETHPVLGKGILVLTDIISSPYPGASVVPSHCRATYDRRLLVGETPEGVLAPIQKVLDEIAAKDPDFKATVHYATGTEKCHTGNEIHGERFFPAWLFEANEAFVQKIDAGLKKIGLQPEITQYSFCTNGSHYAGEAGIRTIGFGPSQENLAHTIDEYIAVEQLEKAANGYETIMEVMLHA